MASNHDHPIFRISALTVEFLSTVKLIFKGLDDVYSAFLSFRSAGTPDVPMPGNEEMTIVPQTNLFCGVVRRVGGFET